MTDTEVNVKNTNDVLDSSISMDEFLKNEENCDDDENSIFSIFDEIKSLCDDKFQIDDGGDRTIEDILKEAEALINQPLGIPAQQKIIKNSISSESTPLEMKSLEILDQYDYSISLHDVSRKFFFIQKHYAFNTAFAITRKKAKTSSPDGIISFAGNINP